MAKQSSVTTRRTGEQHCVQHDGHTAAAAVSRDGAWQPEPGGSACCYWNRYGSSVATRLKDGPDSSRYDSETEPPSRMRKPPDPQAVENGLLDTERELKTHKERHELKMAAVVLSPGGAGKARSPWTATDWPGWMVRSVLMSASSESVTRYVPAAPETTDETKAAMTAPMYPPRDA